MKIQNTRNKQSSENLAHCPMPHIAFVSLREISWRYRNCSKDFFGYCDKFCSCF